MAPGLARRRRPGAALDDEGAARRRCCSRRPASRRSRRRSGASTEDAFLADASLASLAPDRAVRRAHLAARARRGGRSNELRAASRVGFARRPSRRRGRRRRAAARYGAQTTGDEPHYLLTAHSLAEDGDLDVRDELAGRAIGRSTRPARPAGEAARRRPRGQAARPAAARAARRAARARRLGRRPSSRSRSLAGRARRAPRVDGGAAVRRRRRPGGARRRRRLRGVAPLAVYGTQVYPELPAALAVTAAVASPGRRGAARRGRAAVALGEVRASSRPCSRC